MDEFLFVGREEGLGDGVVETIPGAAHGTPDVVVLAVRGEFGRCELRPAVAVKDEDAEILVVAAKIESEIAEFETYDERSMFLAEIGLEESGVARLIKSAYKLLNLETYLLKNLVH